MRKLTYLIIAVTAVSLSASSVFAGQMKDGMMDGGMMKMMHMMHGMMRSSTMVVSNDGGVIVLTGSKLYKYDKNLNLIKEAEIKTEMGGMWMSGMMGGTGGMKKSCCQGKAMMGQDDADDEAAEGEADQPAADDAEHKSHH